MPRMAAIVSRNRAATTDGLSVVGKTKSSLPHPATSLVFRGHQKFECPSSLLSPDISRPCALDESQSRGDLIVAQPLPKARHVSL